MAKRKYETRGGKRPGAGPPKKDPDEKKIQITLYCRKKDVDLLGGPASVKEFLSQEFENKLKNHS